MGSRVHKSPQALVVPLAMNWNTYSVRLAMCCSDRLDTFSPLLGPVGLANRWNAACRLSPRDFRISAHICLCWRDVVTTL